MKIISRRNFLKLTALESILIACPLIAEADNWENAKSFTKRQIDRYLGKSPKDAFAKWLFGEKEEKLRIPYREIPEYKLTTPYELVTEEKGIAKIYWNTQSPRANGFQFQEEIEVRAKLSRAKTVFYEGAKSKENKEDITCFQLEIAVKDYDKENIKAQEDYVRRIKPRRNINGSQSYVWILYPRYGPGTRELVRIIPEEQDFYTIRTKDNTIISGWEKGYSQEEKEAQIIYRLAEKSYDGLINIIARATPLDKTDFKRMAKVIEWWKNEKDYLYKEQGEKLNPEFIAQQIEIYSPRVRCTQEAINIKFAVWNPGKPINFRLFGKICLGNYNTEGGDVKYWKVIQGDNIFAF